MKTKLLLSIGFYLAGVFISNAQNTFPATGAAGIGTTTPNASSLLEIKSTTKGLLIPRMTMAQRNAIVTPATGLMIYQTNSTPGFYYYSGSAWTAVSKGANTALSNLVSPTAVNQILQPGADNTIDLGASAASWKDIYLKGGLYFNGIKMMQYKAGVNTIIGENAGSNGAGGFNTAVGSNVLSVNTTGNANVGIGENSLTYNTIGINNAATGYAALINNTEGNYNVANGFEALYNNTTGTGNTAIGNLSLFSCSTANENTAVGGYSLYTNTTGNGNTATGSHSLEQNTTGSNNTALGTSALFANTNGGYNTAAGMGAMSTNTTGFNNSAYGATALYSNTTGYANAATGLAALYSNTVGSSNTANGNSALYFNSTGNYNTALGGYVLKNNNASENTGIGFGALYANTTGYQNTGTGTNALSLNTTGRSNTANGYDALYANTTGYENTAQGFYALKANTSGLENTATGTYALQSSTTASGNTANGYDALQANTTGYENTAFGAGALQNNVTGTFNTAVGNTADVLSSNLTNATAIGCKAYVDASNKVRVGNTAVTSIGGQVGWSNFSDGRIKKDIKENVPGLKFINALRAVTYHFDLAKENTLLGIKPDNPASDKTEIEKIAFTGFVAQEVDAAAKKTGYDFSGIDKTGKIMALRYAEFVVPLVKAVQELSAENDALKQRLDRLEAAINTQQSSAIATPQTVTVSSASLLQNAPNPFNRSTTITYSLPSTCNTAKIIITDITGKTIKEFSITSAGRGQLNIQAGTLTAGTYNYTLYADGKYIDSKKMEIIR